jgi:hypothetical protein
VPWEAADRKLKIRMQQLLEVLQCRSVPHFVDTDVVAVATSVGVSLSSLDARELPLSSTRFKLCQMTTPSVPKYKNLLTFSDHV